MNPSPAPTLDATSSAAWLAGDGAATIAAAVIGALVLVFGYVVQQSIARRDKRAQVYSEAVRAVEDYMEAPFRILRRDKSVETQRALTEDISEIQSRISYYQAELSIYASNDIAEAYASLVASARREAGDAMTIAWTTRPSRGSAVVPLKSRFSRARTDLALAVVLELMRRDGRGGRRR